MSDVSTVYRYWLFLNISEDVSNVRYTCESFKIVLRIDFQISLFTFGVRNRGRV